MENKKLSLRNILIKATILFVTLNILFALTFPHPLLSKLSLYGSVFPARQRFPFGETPEKAYNFSLNNIEAMFASHEIHNTPKGDEEFRVIIIGDSSVWGYYLDNQDTLVGALNRMNMHSVRGKAIRFYNLGYPTISLTKDLMILDEALKYEPDLVLWMITLEAFPYEKQLFTPLVQHNPERVIPLIEAYTLNLPTDENNFVTPDFWERTIIGQRRALADLWRLQFYGFAWGATNIDQYVPETYDPPANDLEAVESYYGLEPGSLTAEDLAFDVLAAGVKHAGDIPVILINEPIYIASGENNDLRYNFFYPRWVYDAYRELMIEQAIENDWFYFDLWHGARNEEFTNSAIHLSPAGSLQIVQQIAIPIQGIANQK